MLNLQSTVTCRPHGRSDHHHSPATPNTHHTRSHHHFFSPPLPLSSRPHLFPPFLFTFTILLQARLLSPGGQGVSHKHEAGQRAPPWGPGDGEGPSRGKLESSGGALTRSSSDELPRGGGGDLPRTGSPAAAACSPAAAAVSFPGGGAATTSSGQPELPGGTTELSVFFSFFRF
jgi:hypothetical protein